MFTYVYILKQATFIESSDFHVVQNLMHSINIIDCSQAQLHVQLASNHK